jgi:hypothetical protein
MGYELLANGQTQFAIDWDIVSRIVRSYHTANLQLSYAREIRMSESHWYNPLTWSLPAISHVEVDWDAVRADADSFALADVRNMRVEAKYNAPRIARRVEALIEMAAHKKETFVDWIGKVQTENMKSINKAVEDYEASAEIARFVRDTSADGLMVGASVMTGGAAVAALGGASFFKGTCKFQDTGRVGAGLMQGAGSFAFAYVKLGKNFTFRQDMVLALVQAQYATGTELVGGATVSKAVVSSALKLTGPSIDRLFKLGPAKTLFDKVAVPIVVTYGGENVASKFLSKLAGKAVHRGFEERRQGVPGDREDRGKKAVNDSTSTGEIEVDLSPRRQGQVIAESTVSTKFLLHLAFVNMDKGIGRGW